MANMIHATRYIILQKKTSFDRKRTPKYSIYKSTVYKKKRQCDLAFNFLYTNLEYDTPNLSKNGFATVIKFTDDLFALAFYTKEGKATHAIEFCRREIAMDLPNDVSLQNVKGNIVMTIDDDMIPNIVATYGTMSKPKVYCGGSNTYHSFNFNVK